MPDIISNDQDKRRICVGRIVGPHGVRGLAKVLFFGEDESLLDEHGPLSNKSGSRLFQLKRKNSYKQGWLVSIEGFDNPEDIKALGKTDLYIARDKLPHADEDEFYDEDLKGLRVLLHKNKEEIGLVHAVHSDYGPQTILEIKAINQSDFMIPFTKEYIPEVNIEKGYLTIDPLDGMMS